MNENPPSAPQPTRPLPLAVVVPCKNEAKNIRTCLEALLRQPVAEIHVVDNGSDDGTPDIVRELAPAVTLHELADVSISELRNRGVEATSAEWIAFVDGDVEVGPRWYEQILETVSALKDEGQDTDRVLTGSTYVNPPEPTWVERVWYDQLSARDAVSTGYVNGGNLVLSRRAFERVGGFDPRYPTGEDVRFCVAARENGVEVRKVPGIVAIHHGYPKTLRHFYMRERWHGLGMVNHLSRFWKERDLSLALYNLALIPLFLIGALALRKPWLSAAGAIALGVLPLLAMAARRAARVVDIPPLTTLYLVYGWAKSAA